MKLVTLIKLCFNEACTKVRIRKYLYDALSVQDGLKNVVLYHYCFSTLH